MVRLAVEVEGRAVGPDGREDEEYFIQLPWRVSRSVGWSDQSVKQRAQNLYMTDTRDRSYLLELLADLVVKDGDVLVKQDVQVSFLNRVLPLLNPAGDEGVPTEVSGVDVSSPSSPSSGPSESEGAVMPPLP